jgi:hypothetical protein
LVSRAVCDRLFPGVGGLTLSEPVSVSFSFTQCQSSALSFTGEFTFAFAFSEPFASAERFPQPLALAGGRQATGIRRQHLDSLCLRADNGDFRRRLPISDGAPGYIKLKAQRSKIKVKFKAEILITVLNFDLVFDL